MTKVERELRRALTAIVSLQERIDEIGTDVEEWKRRAHRSEGKAEALTEALKVAIAFGKSP